MIFLLSSIVGLMSGDFLDLDLLRPVFDLLILDELFLKLIIELKFFSPPCSIISANYIIFISFSLLFSSNNCTFIYKLFKFSIILDVWVPSLKSVGRGSRVSGSLRLVELLPLISWGSFLYLFCIYLGRITDIALSKVSIMFYFSLKENFGNSLSYFISFKKIFPSLSFILFWIAIFEFSSLNLFSN